MHSMSEPIIVPGRVVDADGAGVSGVAVAFVDGPAPFPDIAAISDGVGMFTLTAPSEGRWIVGVNADGTNHLVEVDVPPTEVVEIQIP